MKKRTISLFLVLILSLAVMVAPAVAAEPIGGNLDCSNDPIRTEIYTTEYGWDETLYIFPEGTTFCVANSQSGWIYLTAYDPSEVGDISLGQDYVFYSDTERFAPEPGHVYHLVVSDSMSGTEFYVMLEEGAVPSQPSEPVEPADQPADWAAEQVNEGIELGVVPETLRSDYQQATTRAEFCALAVGLYETVTGSEITGRVTFTDTEDENVEKMAFLGVVNGVGEDKFEPDASLARQEAATMLARLAEALDKPLEEQASTFADNASVASWAMEAVGQMQSSGVMNGTGDNKFSPNDPYERQQSIVTIMRLHELVK